MAPELGSQFQHSGAAPRPDSGIRAESAMTRADLLASAFQLTVIGRAPIKTLGIEFGKLRDFYYVVPPDDTERLTSSKEQGGRTAVLKDGALIVLSPTVVTNEDAAVLEREIERGRQKRAEIEATGAQI